MHLLKFVSAALATGAFVTVLSAAAVCPLTSLNDAASGNGTPDATGCGVLITFGASGSPTISVTGTAAIDNSEDTTVGVINNSSNTVSSLTLHATDASDAFGINDGDGIESGYTITNGVAVGSGGATGYEGPTSTFDLSGVDSSGGGTLVVNFAPGIAPGGNSYFSLEGDPATAGGGISVGPSSGVPEPSTYGLLAIGLLGLLGVAKRRFGRA